MHFHLVVQNIYSNYRKECIYNACILTRPLPPHGYPYYWFTSDPKSKLEQLERLRSEDTPRRLMITHTIESCWIPSQNKVEWPWRYRSRSKVITCDTPSHASNHLYQIWKESIQNYRRYRADTIFKVKAEWPWKYRWMSKVMSCNTLSNANDRNIEKHTAHTIVSWPNPDDLCQIWKEYKQNCRFFFKVKAEKFKKIAKNKNFRILL